MTRLTMAVAACAAIAALSTGCSTTVPVRADSITFYASASWIPEETSHPSRKLEFRIPSGQPDMEDARLVVWNFPTVRDAGDGRVIQRNINQWMGQFVQDDGTPTDVLARRAEYRINGMPVHTLDVAGRLVSDSSSGPGVRVDHPTYRMKGAYVVSPQGDYLVKFIGPAEVVERHGEAFDTFLKTARAGRMFPVLEPEGSDDAPRGMLTASPARP